MRTVTEGKDCLLVVAHPDDETMWFSSLLTEGYAKSWTVLCMSVPRIDPIRAWKFYEACAVLGARGEVVPFVESGPGESLDTLDLMGTPRFNQDVIATHGAHGEYGHKHHIDVHHAVVDHFPGRPIITTQPFEHTARPLSPLHKQALRCYDHMTDYPPLGRVPKWEALEHRYGQVRQSFALYEPEVANCA